MKKIDENNKLEGEFFKLPPETDTSGLWDSHSETLQVSPENTAPITAGMQKENEEGIKDFYEMAKEGENLPEFKKLLGNYLLEKNTVLMVGERGSGKTYLALQIALKVAGSDSEFLGEEIQLHGNVLCINMELGYHSITKRMTKLCKSTTPEEDMPYKPYCYTVRKDLSKIMPQLEKWIKKHQPVLVIIDNLRTAFSGSQNEKNNEMTNAIMALNDFRDKHNCTILIVHHTKKGTSNQRTSSDLQSGAGAISDLVDADCFLRRTNDTNLRILKRVKSRNSEEQENAKLIRLSPDTLWFELVEEDVDEGKYLLSFDPGGMSKDALITKARALREEGKSFEQIGLELGKDKSTISRWFKE